MGKIPISKHETFGICDSIFNTTAILMLAKVMLQDGRKCFCGVVTPLMLKKQLLNCFFSLKNVL